jgi:hypothetical protein
MSHDGVAAKTYRGIESHEETSSYIRRQGNVAGYYVGCQMIHLSMYLLVILHLRSACVWVMAFAMSLMRPRYTL